MGWPLLRRAIKENIEASKESEARKLSVVQWVMNLPDRSLLSVQSATSDLIKELEIILRNNLSSCKWFQYDELQISTNYFSTENLIGEEDSSQVYKGCLPNGEKVAIKLSKLSEETSRDFLLEADIITKLKHERIVPLLGICVECTTFLSIYGYFSNGSLEENLHAADQNKGAFYSLWNSVESALRDYKLAANKSTSIAGVVHLTNEELAQVAGRIERQERWEKEMRMRIAPEISVTEPLKQSRGRKKAATRGPRKSISRGGKQSGKQLTRA